MPPGSTGRDSPATTAVRRLAVATSGGLDSTALLHCTARLAVWAGVEVHALHVHHGLMEQADAWLAQVAAQCRRWRAAGLPISFHSHRVAERPSAGDSIEAWARRVRYRALADMAHAAGCTVVLLAHHRRDQAETVLLQALRGAGPAGLSAMPVGAQRQGLVWSRPWLSQPRDAIAAYARRWRLGFVVDPSNTDGRYARSRLRHDVWPALMGAFGDAEVALASVASRAQEARDIVDEVAAQDLLQAGQADGLAVAAWLSLSAARRANVLRHWLTRALAVPVPESLVQRLTAELPSSRAGRWPAGAYGELRLHAGMLRPVAARSVRLEAPALPRTIDLSQAGTVLAHPWPGRFRLEEVANGGVPAALMCHAELRPRVGGERFQCHAAGVPRSLKKQFQDQGVAAWMRDGPLVFAGEALVFVPGLGLDARVMALPGSPRLQIDWQC